MKTRILAGWKTRFHSVCLMMLVSATATLAFAGNAAAQEAATPPATEMVAETAGVAEAAADVAAAEPAAEAAAEEEAVLDSGDTAWMLTSTLLVLLMIVPGLALFYG